MNWSYANSPDPEISIAWKDEFWPTNNYSDIADRAIWNIGEFWDFDDIQVCQKTAARITKEQHFVLAINVMVNQVCNGGFTQALFNSYGQISEEAIEGFTYFGLHKFADLIEQALDRFGVRPVPQNRGERIQRLRVLSGLVVDPSDDRFDGEICQNVAPLWDDLNDRFFQLLRDGSGDLCCRDGLYKPLAHSIYDHRDRFFLKQGSPVVAPQRNAHDDAIETLRNFMEIEGSEASIAAAYSKLYVDVTGLRLTDKPIYCSSLQGLGNSDFDWDLEGSFILPHKNGYRKVAFRTSLNAYLIHVEDMRLEANSSVKSAPHAYSPIKRRVSLDLTLEKSVPDAVKLRNAKKAFSRDASFAKRILNRLESLIP